jgi:uncharacterized protein (DUF2147 family)
MKMLNKMVLGLAGLAVSAVAMADPAGTWRTIDDQTGQPKSIVVITNNGGEYKARIQKVLSGDVCDVCEGRFKGKNLAGETIMWGVRSEGGNVYSGGTILDPKTNKHYKVKITDNGGTLTVRGYIGVSLLGRNQTWQRM